MLCIKIQATLVVNKDHLKKKTLRQKKFYFGALVFYQFSRVETDHFKKNYFMLVKRLFIHLFQFFNKFLKAINPFIPMDWPKWFSPIWTINFRRERQWEEGQKKTILFDLILNSQIQHYTKCSADSAESTLWSRKLKFQLFMTNIFTRYWVQCVQFLYVENRFRSLTVCSQFVCFHRWFWMRRHPIALVYIEMYV